MIFRIILKQNNMKIENHDIVVAQTKENFPVKGKCGGNSTHLGKLNADKIIW